MSLAGFLVDQFYHNQFMTAAVVAAPMTALAYTARSLPVKAWHAVKRQLCTEIGFNSDIPDYLSVQEYVAKSVVREAFSRSFLYTAESHWEQGQEVVDFRGLTLGYGGHIGTWRRRLVFIERILEQGQQTEKFKERLTLTFLTRNQGLVDEFAKVVRENGERALDRDAVSLWINNDGWWKLASRIPPRQLSTVFTASEEGERLLQHIREFDGRRDYYRQRGLPYHTGVLLTGEPGTGKTSLIHAVASETGRSIHYLNLGSVEHDKQLTELVSSGRGWGRSILVIEDADASRVDVSRDGEDNPKTPLTLSAMLNLLDGLLTPDGLVVVATSNHPERLDPALVRPGRFDLRIDVSRLDWPAFVKMAEAFGHTLRADDPRRHRFAPTPGAEMRAKLLSGGVEEALAA